MPALPAPTGFSQTCWYLAAGLGSACAPPSPLAWPKPPATADATRASQVTRASPTARTCRSTAAARRTTTAPLASIVTKRPRHARSDRGREGLPADGRRQHSRAEEQWSPCPGRGWLRCLRADQGHSLGHGWGPAPGVGRGRPRAADEDELAEVACASCTAPSPGLCISPLLWRRSLPDGVRPRAVSRMIGACRGGCFRGRERRAQLA
mmetsp:Transcript_20177/g.53917  ORF Transcript_20177/g.53917 Transcript_20177/m.53917 type:complete len:208 (-) Transcript_20177:9-632(-)